MKDTFFDRIYINPIIAAVNNIEKLQDAIESPCEIVFLLTGSIFNLEKIVYKAKEKDKQIYVHIDLLAGFSRDSVSLKYIYEKVRPDGIISTKNNLIRHANEMHLFTIQRFFILDSLSLESCVKSVKSTKSNAIEIIPGIMPRVIKDIHNQTNIPIITGGLIKDKEDVIQSLKAGAIGISTSKEEIWSM